MTSVSPDSYSAIEAATGRTPPWNGEAEQAVLGAMMLDQDAALRAVELLTADMFYREAHRRLFRAMTTLTEQRVVIDHVTLRDELSRKGELDDAGGVEYLAELVDSVPTSANLEFHASIVREKAILRRLIEAATSIIGDAYAGRTSANELLDSAESRVFHISQERQQVGFTRIKEMLWPTMERIETLHRSGKTVTGVPSGFVDLDEMTSGFQKSELIIVAARPSMGKTSLCLNIATHAALENIGVAVFSLEMSKDSLVQRMLCAEARVDSQLVRRGMLRDHDFTKLARAAGILQGAPIWIDDTPAMTLLEMRSKARRLKAENDLGMIVVDYLQLMRSPEYSENRVQEISDISRSLKALSRELEVPVMALSQLSRASEQRGGDRKPILSDLRDSGAIEQDADVVLFIHRPEMYNREDAEGRTLEGVAELIVAKHRNGPTGSVDLHFEKSITRFDNLSERESPGGLTMARPRSVYRCAECGHDHPKWVGRCEGCGAWGSVAEEPIAVPQRRTVGRSDRRTESAASPVALSDISQSRLARWSTGIAEFDFVLGGGLVPGSLVLIGGEPGIGKSTLLLQAAARLEAAGRRTLYASGEESPEQVKLRADRLVENAGPVLVLGETRLEAILDAAGRVEAQVLMVDSIQTAYTDTLEGAPGSVGQVRESASLLMRFAKESGIATVLVGHVTKGGNIAGPKTLEHIVDTVLYFEGEPTLDYRLLRATKNRFGSVDELGVFTMTGQGLEPVANPSAVFLGSRAVGTVGTAVTALMEGSRPVLVEVQALAAPSGYGTPQRVSTGLDPRRLAVLLAVLEMRAGARFAQQDVFVQVAGGLKLTEPAADLAVAAALLSSLHNRPTPPDAIYLGELGLGGEIRPIAGLDRRLGEAGRLGFRRVIASERGVARVAGLTHLGLSVISDLAGTLAA